MINDENYMSTPTIEVLLSTYNGEKYIDQQLMSLIKQEDVIIHILIRDDGSQDKTLEIVERYAKEYDFISIIKGKNKGFAKSFWDLIQKSGEYEYYAFCDQDDIWDKRKLISAIELIKKKNIKSPKPTLYTSDVQSMDNNFNLLKKHTFGFKGTLSLDDSLIRSVLPGCTFVFNNELKKIACQYHGRIISHDWLIYQIALIFGQVVFDNNVYMNYRIHENNTIGVETKFGFIKSRINNLIKDKNKTRRTDVVKDILDCYGTQLSVDVFNELVLFVNANKLSCLIKLLKKKEYRRFNFIFMALLKKI